MKLFRQKVWCPATQQTVTVTGTIILLANQLSEFTVKECSLQGECEKIRDHECLVKERLQGRW